MGFGQTVCPSAGKRCGECKVGLEGLCKAADRGKVAAGRKAAKMKGGVNEEGELKMEAEAEAKVKVEEGNEMGEVTSVVKKEYPE